MEETVAKYAKLCFKLDKTLPRTPAVVPLKESVEQFKSVIPVVQVSSTPFCSSSNSPIVRHVVAMPVLYRSSSSRGDVTQYASS